MNDPITVLLALCTFAGGVSALVRPDWYYDPAKPEKRKGTLWLGLALTLAGSALLYCVLFLNR